MFTVAARECTFVIQKEINQFKKKKVKKNRQLEKVEVYCTHLGVKMDILLAQIHVIMRVTQ